MTRYKEHKHGIVIGSDNFFFFKDWGNFYHETKCIWWAKGYNFDNYSTLHLDIETPLRQLIYYNHRVEFMKPFTYPDKPSFGDKAGTTIEIPEYAIFVILRPYFVSWLNTNAQGWFCPVGKGRDGTIFFQKRKHALEFTKLVHRLLAGMDYM